MPLLFFRRLLLKQVVTMEVIQWTTLWNTYKAEFENEKSMLGGSLGDKAADDLKQRIIEHVVFPISIFATHFSLYSAITFADMWCYCRTFLLCQSITLGLP